MVCLHILHILDKVHGEHMDSVFDLLDLDATLLIALLLLKKMAQTLACAIVMIRQCVDKRATINITAKMLARAAMQFIHYYVPRQH